MLEVSLLGSGGMIPLEKRHLSSLILKYNGKSLLIDCGEGTQISLKKTAWSFKSIDIICFTHYHCDHIAGLPGLLLSIGNSGRIEPIKLLGLKGLKYIVEGLLRIAPYLPYKLEFLELEEEIKAFKLGGFKIKTYPMKHSIECLAYSIEIERLAKFQPEKAKKIGLEPRYWGRLQKGEELDIEGKIYKPEMVLGDKRKGIKVVYCTDTRPCDNILKAIDEDTDLFICEGMYGAKEDQEKAEKHSHMSFSEAGNLAKKAGVKELWLTHYSPAMKNPEDYLEETRKIFKNTKLGFDRKSKIIMFEDEE